MGESLRDQKASSLYNELSGLKPQIKNRFDNYVSPYDMGMFNKNLDTVFGGYKDLINKSTAQNIANQQKNTAASMASRGITGGSILADTQSKIASDIGKGKSDALANLGISKANISNDLMKYFNSLDLSKNQLASNIDLANIGNLFRKYGMQTNNLQFLNDDTALDDFLALLNTSSGFVNPLSRLFSGSGGASGAK